MKITADGKQVSSRSWYYLLEFNEIGDRSLMVKISGKQRLKDLNFREYTQLFKEATESEIGEM